jgi:hypothetical protein
MECNGVQQSLQGWGITRAVLRLISLATDTFTFEIAVQDIFSDPFFSFGDQINLYQDGVRIFSGQITKLPIAGTPNQETQSYTASGPWYYLSRVVYMQSRLVYNGDIVTPETTTVDSSRVMMFMGASVAAAVHNGLLIYQAINFAITRFHVPIQFGDTDLTLQPPMQEVRDSTCADIIIYSAKWTPDAVGWFDYSVDPPAFYCKRRASLSPVTIDPKNETSSLVQSFKITPRPDLQVVGVLFTFEQTIIVNDVQKVALNSQGAGDITSIDTITHTFTLQGATDKVQESPPPGLALGFYNATKTLQWEGEINTVEEECSFIVRPGNALLFPSNCPTRYQTMNALVQQCEYELVTGESSFSFGPPTQLGPQDFAALIAASRGTSPTSNLANSGSTDGGTGNTTTPPSPNPFPNNPSGDPWPKTSLEDCDGHHYSFLAAPT